MVEDGVAVISLVDEDMASVETGQQRDRELGIADMAAGQDEAHRSSEGIDRDMPFGGQSSSGAPQSLVAEPPF